MSNSPESIIVVGASNAGKTTLVRGLRTPEYKGKVVIPTRYTTRPPRANEDPDENIHLEEAEFHQRVYEQTINPHWSRYFEDDRKEYYGFEPVPLDDDRLPVYAANNAFLRDVEGFRKDLLMGGLVVVVKSSQESRHARMIHRSSDLSEAERAVRLADVGGDVAIGDFEQRVIDTTDKLDDEGQLALRAIIDEILATRQD